MYLKQPQQYQPSMKLIKCRSHDNLIHPINTDRSISTQQQIGTRPKFQSIRSKNQYENQPFIWWKSDGCVGDGDGEVRNGRNGGLGRVRSVDKFQSVRETQQYENIVQAYKEQNSNLKQQNKYLQNQIKKRRKNEQTLTNYITHLQQQIKKLDMQSRTRQSTSPPITSRSKNKPPLPNTNTNINTIKNYKNDLMPLLNSKVGIDEGDTCNTMEEIQQLNQRFNVLMEQCSKEDCRRNRHAIREKLAETAERMRVFRREFGEG